MSEDESKEASMENVLVGPALHTTLLEMNKQQRFDLREFACGCGAAFVNITITYPIYKVIFRQMLHGVGFSSALRQMSQEGGTFLYRGMLPPLCQKAVSLSIMFGVYEECRAPLEKANFPPLIAKSTAAVVAGTAEAILMPFERVQTLLQDHHYHDKFRNTTHVMRALAVEYGYKEYYRGMVPILLRNTISNVMFFLMRDEAKYRLPKPSSWWGELLKEFTSGAVIGAFISTVIYPFNVVKVQMQSSIGGHFPSFFTVLLQVYRERGLRNMYRGVHMNYTRSFISWGIINASYDLFKKILFPSTDDTVVISEELGYTSLKLK